MTLNKLFKQTKGNKVQEWLIEIDGNRYRTIVGQSDGKKITSNWTSCEGKNKGKANETSPEEQAIKQAKALWQGKVDKGYYEDVKDIGQKKFFEPMLAENYKDYKDEIEFPIYAQPKLDGIRCICSKNGMFSRNGKVIVSAPHIMEQLSALFEKYPDLILDGELYNHKLKNDFNKIVSLVNKEKLTDEDKKESLSLVQYTVYDCFIDKTYSGRLEFLSSLLCTDNVHFCLTTELCKDQNELDSFYEKLLNDGYEGQMLRIDTGYQNKRTKALLKRKESETNDFQILGFVEGNGNREGTVGKFNFEINGKSFDSDINGGMEYVTKLWKNRKQMLGKTATIKHWGYTPDGKPRFPRVIAIRDYE